MARPFIPEQVSGDLLLELDTDFPGFHQVYFMPSEDSMNYFNVDRKKSTKTHCIDVSVQNNYITIYPFSTSQGKFLKPKYDVLKSITFSNFKYAPGLGYITDEDNVIDLIQSLPVGFVKDFHYGLGLKSDYRFLVDTLESFGIENLVIDNTEPSTMDIKKSYCTLNIKDFHGIRKIIDRVTHKARKTASQAKDTLITNVLCSFFDENDPAIMDFIKENDQSLTEIESTTLFLDSLQASALERRLAITTVSRNAKEILKNDPETLIKLQNEIELVSLEKLIEKFSEYILKNMKEESWQKLFDTNPFILSLIFGAPIIKVKSGAYIGGKKISGDGDKIADFLVKNNLTNNAAIIEIKKPNTKLFNKNVYRGGVYTPHAGFSGAVTQLLDQQYQFQRSISYIKDVNKLSELETYSVQGVLVIGKLPVEQDQIKSFELFRSNFKGVIVITFDELLTRLKQLHLFLSQDKGEIK